MIGRRTASFSLLLLIVVGRLGADILILPNGERISGNYLGVRDGNIQFETEHLGVVQGSEDALEVELTADSAFAGYIPPMLAWRPPETVASHYLPGDDEPVELQEEPTGMRALSQRFLPEGWSGVANFGFSRLNTDSTVESVVFAAEATRTSGDNEYLFAGAYDYGLQTSPQGVDTKNIDRYSTRFRWTHHLTDLWSFQTRSIYLKDMLRDIDHSATQSLGIGYKLLQEERIELAVTPAIAGRYIDAQGFDQHWLGLATLYQNLVYHINHSLRLEQEGSAEYNPGQPVEYAYDFRSGFVADVTDWVEAGVIYEYNFDNIVGPGADKVEERILVQLGVPF